MEEGINLNMEIPPRGGGGGGGDPMALTQIFKDSEDSLLLS